MRVAQMDGIVRYAQNREVPVQIPTDTRGRALGLVKTLPVIFVSNLK